MIFSVFTRCSFRLCLCVFRNFRYFSANNGKITTSYYHEKGTFTFLQSTLGDLVDEAAEDCGDDIALVLPFQNIRKTFYQFKEETDQLAAGLIGLELRPGDRIGIYSPNSYELLLTQYAAFKAGLIAVNINPASTEKELANILEKVECRAIVAPESFKTKEYYKMLCAVIPEIPKSHPGRINSQRLRQLQNVIIISEKKFPGTYRLQDVKQADGSTARQQLSERRKTTQFDNPAIIMFTSGTTGTPKAATVSHFQIVNQSLTLVKKLGFEHEKPVICLQVPLFHSFASVGGPPVSLQCRGKCVIPARHFDPLTSIKTIIEEKCTMVYGVPTMFNEMLQHLRGKQYNVQHWKKVLVGASPVPMELMKILQNEFGLNVMNGYGTTETGGVVSVQSHSDSHKTLGSSGKPPDFSEVKIVDTSGRIVPVNTNGEVLCRSPYIFIGYWGQPKETAKVLDNTRWYHTGDIGKMDEEGNIYVTGRIKDMVIRGGVNIYPSEIENFLITHPAIADVYVVGVPDQKFGEELCASIKLKPGCTITEDEIKAFCKDKISYFKVPRYILFCEDYPKTESGKIIKHKLREHCSKRLKL